MITRCTMSRSPRTLDSNYPQTFHNFWMLLT